MITNGTIQRELTAADWHRLNGLLAEAFELEGEARTAVWRRCPPRPGGSEAAAGTSLLADAGSTRFDGTSPDAAPQSWRNWLLRPLAGHAPRGDR